MGRHEQPVPPGPLHEFASGLRALRAAAGNPTYRELAQRARYSSTALSAAAAGQSLPTLELTLAYVGACGGDVSEWEIRWRQAGSPPAADPSAVAIQDGEDPDAARTPTRTVRASKRIRRARVPIILGAVLAGCAIVITTVSLADSRHGSATPASTARAAAVPGGRSSPSGSADYDQTTGPGCPDVTTATTGHDDSSPAHHWIRARVLHRTGDACTDLLMYSAPSTETNPDRWQDDYEWYFAGVPRTASCTFHIYIPASPFATYTASYDWTAGTLGYLETTAFTIDQSAHRGTWYDKGPYSFTTGKAMLEITDARSPVPDAPLTAAAARLTCS